MVYTITIKIIINQDFEHCPSLVFKFNYTRYDNKNNNFALHLYKRSNFSNIQLTIIFIRF